jgi:hypothetical protein
VDLTAREYTSDNTQNESPDKILKIASDFKTIKESQTEIFKKSQIKKCRKLQRFENSQDVNPSSYISPSNLMLRCYLPEKSSCYNIYK